MNYRNLNILNICTILINVYNYCNKGHLLTIFAMVTFGFFTLRYLSEGYILMI